MLSTKNSVLRIRFVETQIRMRLEIEKISPFFKAFFLLITQKIILLNKY